MYIRAWVQFWVCQSKSKQKIELNMLVCEVAFARLLTVEDKVVSLINVGIWEVLMLEPKCSRMQSHRDEPRPVRTGYPAQGQQNSSSVLMQSAARVVMVTGVVV